MVFDDPAEITVLHDLQDAGWLHVNFERAALPPFRETATVTELTPSGLASVPSQRR